MTGSGHGLIASIMLQWGRSRLTAEIRQLPDGVLLAELASMGPQSFDCGNMYSLVSRHRGSDLLQWGRSRLTAEMIASNTAQSQVESLQWGRSRLTAEMKSSDAAVRRRHSLQWGRSRLTAEIRKAKNDREPVGLLQWGRSRLTAEMIGHAWAIAEKVVASMGPQSFDCGNHHSFQATFDADYWLQWGRSRLTAEISWQGCHCGRGESGFNGAAVV